MLNIALTLAYDGGAYLGWQDNAHGSTIEATLRQVLEQILQQPLKLQAASRTDVGVHAEGQVVNFVIDRKGINLESLHKSVNALLPSDMAVKELWKADLNFHPTLDCIGKEYHYHLCLGQVQLPLLRHTSWHCPYDLDIAAMKGAAEKLIGTHNFRAFCNMRKGLNYDSFERSITRLDVVPVAGQRLRIEVEGSSFLYKMVRNLVGTLVYVGRGELTVDDVARILDLQDRTQAGVTAPAHGLSLMRVAYP